LLLSSFFDKKCDKKCFAFFGKKDYNVNAFLQYGRAGAPAVAGKWEKLKEDNPCIRCFEIWRS
jgi:hypothetical protein